MNQVTVTKDSFYQPIKSNWIDQSGLDMSAFNKEVSFAIQIFHSNKYLQGCDEKTVLKAIMNVAQTTLTLNPILKYAYLIPRWNTKENRLDCCLDPSYIGMVKLLTDSGSVKSINCQIIYEGDVIEVDMVSEKKITKHVPYLIAGNAKGNIKGVYSLAKLSDDSYHVEIMSMPEVEEIREKSESWKAYKSGKAKACIWETSDKTPNTEMVRKTCIKRHVKHLPHTRKTEHLERAVAVSNESSGFLETCSYEQIGFIEQLITTSNMSPDERGKMEAELVLIEYKYQASKMIEYLLENQLTPGVDVDFTGQKQIMKQTTERADREK